MLETAQDFLSSLLNNGQLTTLLVAAACLYIAWLLISRILSFIALSLLLLIGLYYIDPALVEQGFSWIQEHLLGGQPGDPSLLDRAKASFNR